MRFENYIATEVTNYAFKVNKEYEKSGYIRLFICPDVNDTYLFRVLKGYGKDYEKDDDSYILERQEIPNEYKGQQIIIQRLKRILIEDDLSNFEYHVSNNLNDLISIIDGGFGILNLK